MISATAPPTAWPATRGLSLTDVQWVLGHARPSTTQTYLNPVADDVIASVLAYHARRAGKTTERPAASLGYRTESLDVLFSRETS